MADETLMRAALAVARRGLLAGEAPVGACIVQAGRVIASAHTAVAGGPDASAHAEILAIRAACRSLRSARLDGCELYVSVEPCAMCLAACHYAGIGQVFFAASLQDMQALTGGELAAPVPASVCLHGEVLAAESKALLAEWALLRRERPRA
ncbi:MAG: nucleoside deaminase [Gammaproteobacteria bacterium]